MLKLNKEIAEGEPGSDDFKKLWLNQRQLHEILRQAVRAARSGRAALDPAGEEPPPARALQSQRGRGSERHTQQPGTASPGHRCCISLLSNPAPGTEKIAVGQGQSE